MSDEMESSLIDSVASEHIEDIVLELAEVGLDQLLEEGVLRDIPIIGSLQALYKTGLSVRNQLYVRKVMRFLFELKDIPIEKRQSFARKLEEDEQEGRRVGEAVLLILEQADDMQKPEIIGRIFKALIEERIDRETALRMSATVNRAFLPDLADLVRVYGGEQIDLLKSEQLANLGLVSSQAEIARMGAPTPLEYSINEYGRLLVEIALI